MAVAAPGAEVGDAQSIRAAQLIELGPEFGLGKGIELVQFVFAEAVQPCAGGTIARPASAIAQLVDDRKGVDLPQGHIDPQPGEGQLVLTVLHLEMILRKPVSTQELYEVRVEQIAPAIELVTRQPDGLALREAQGAGMIELIFQFRLIDDIGEADIARAVDQGESHGDVRVPFPDELQHEQLVNISIQQGSNDGIDVEALIIRSRGEIDHVIALCYTSRGVALSFPHRSSRSPGRTAEAMPRTGRWRPRNRPRRSGRLRREPAGRQSAPSPRPCPCPSPATRSGRVPAYRRKGLPRCRAGRNSLRAAPLRSAAADRRL